MPSRVDLHTHTTASDGTLSPEELLRKASELQIRVLAVTDHDSTAGYDSLEPVRRRYPDVRLIPGIEINTEGDLACHILGYFIDPSRRAFQERLVQYRRLRLDRARAMAIRLGELGHPIDFERVLSQAGDGSVGRPHLADALREKGVVRTRQEAFDRFLKKDGPAYVASQSPSAPEAIRLIRQAGGVPVLAHPAFYSTEDLFRKLAAEGLMGLEVYYPDHSRGLIRRYLDVASELGLVATGGSDFHGPRTGRPVLGCVDVPEAVIEALEKARNQV